MRPIGQLANLLACAPPGAAPVAQRVCGAAWAVQRCVLARAVGTTVEPPSAHDEGGAEASESAGCCSKNKNTLEGLSAEELAKTGLPSIAERARNLIAAGLRSQASTVRTTDLERIRESPRGAVHSSIVDVAPIDPPEVLVVIDRADAEGRQHFENLRNTERMSLAYGTASTSAVARLLASAGRTQERCVVYGTAREAPPGALGHAMRLLDRARARQHLGSLRGDPPAQPGGAAHTSGDRLALSFSPESVTYIDRQGRTMRLSADEVHEAYTDPLAASQAAIVGALNQSGERRAAFAAFCAGYMGREVRDAVMVQVDRGGFTLLAQEAGADGAAPVHTEFRFQFQREARDAGTLGAMLDDMARECGGDVQGASQAR
ncbi:unnamed protein product [Pedinophyceae sp. YPF-701]|nr:unnamed protein product [Pedinophyceae sp. YPF-701]